MAVSTAELSVQHRKMHKEGDLVVNQSSRTAVNTAGRALPGGVPFTGVVALDGPSGTGKSTVARGLAQALGARYLDTGAMYRAVTVAVLRAGIGLNDAEAIADCAATAALSITTDAAPAVVRLGASDVSAQIRSAEVTAAVSAVSAVPAVRAQLVAQQRELIGAGGIVVEGRDIAAVVWPAARPKVYLTASEQVRALRRAGDVAASQGSAGVPVDVQSVAADLARRDRLDASRAVSPAVRPDGSVELDTSELTIAEVIARLIDMTLHS